MREWLNDSDILKYLTYNEGNSVIAERFIKKLKSKIYKRVTANDTNSCLSYLNKLLEICNNTYHLSIGKKLNNADYSALTEKTEMATNPKGPKFEDRVRNTGYKKNFSKSYTENLLREMFIIESVLKTNPCT